jgi:hypothetical protein
MPHPQHPVFVQSLRVRDRISSFHVAEKDSQWAPQSAPVLQICQQSQSHKCLNRQVFQQLPLLIVEAWSCGGFQHSFTFQ